MYKAIKPIGKYKPGDIVPDELAEVWLQMYSTPHVEKVEETEVNKEKSELPVLKKKEEKDVDKETNELCDWYDDYLDRNQWVVVKAIERDTPSKDDLKKLLELEQKDKKRKAVIKALKIKLKE